MALEGRALLGRRGRGHRHAVTLEDLRHLLAVGRAAAGGTDHLGSLAEVCGAHYRRGYEGELFHILAAEVVETVYCAPGDAQRLSRTDPDGRAVDRPGEDALDAVEDLLVGIVHVGRRRQLLSGGDENLEHGHATIGVSSREEEPDPKRTNPDSLLGVTDKVSVPERPIC